MLARHAWWFAVVLAAACGRLNYDAREAPVDAPADATCPAGTTELSPGSPVCIELVERGNEPWTVAKSTCEGLGRRLCADAEWLEGCVNAIGLVDMIDGGFEWVAEEVGGVAQKRGPDACTATSSHAVVDPYEYRCCADR